MKYGFYVINSDIRDIASSLIIYNSICLQGLKTFLTLWNVIERAIIIFQVIAI